MACVLSDGGLTMVCGCDIVHLATGGHHAIAGEKNLFCG